MRHVLPVRSVLTTVTSLSLLAAPTVVSAQQAGQLIAAEPVVDTPGGMQAWRIRYWTSDGSGRPREVTGIVVAPREAIPARPRDVLAWIADRFAGRPAPRDCGQS